MTTLTPFQEWYLQQLRERGPTVALDLVAEWNFRNARYDSILYQRLVMQVGDLVGLNLIRFRFDRRLKLEYAEVIP